jgi:hypothetical protein
MVINRSSITMQMTRCGGEMMERAYIAGGEGGGGVSQWQVAHVCATCTGPIAIGGHMGLATIGIDDQSREPVCKYLVCKQVAVRVYLFKLNI